MLLLNTIIFFALLSFCNSQDLEIVESKCNGDNNYEKATSCIKYYRELELYVRGDRLVIEQLKLFFSLLDNLLLSLSNCSITSKFLVLMLMVQSYFVPTVQLHIFGVSQLSTCLVHALWHGPHFLQWIYQYLTLPFNYHVSVMMSMTTSSLD